MKIKAFIFSANLLLSTISFCQSYHKVYLQGEEIKLTNNDFNVTKVIDERVDKKNIGWVQKGMSNRLVGATFNSPFEEEIQKFLNKNLDQRGTSIKIQLVIKNLKISEQTSFSSEKAFCDLSVDFYVETDTDLIRVLKTTQRSSVKGMEVTRSHASNIAYAFKLCFEDLAKIDITDAVKFAKSNIKADSVNIIPDSITYNFPIFKEAIKTGLYNSFEDFKNNKPGITNIFHVETEPRSSPEWIGTYNVIPVYSSTNKRVKKIWGFAYDGQVFISHQKEFFPLIIKNYDLYFYGYGIPTGEPAMTGAFFGGVVGAAIGAGVESSRSKNEKLKYTLNPLTGIIMCDPRQAR